MAFKSFVISALSTTREKLNVAELIDRELNTFEKSGKAKKINSFHIDSEFNHSGHGNALVTVHFEPAEEKKTDK